MDFNEDIVETVPIERIDYSKILIKLEAHTLISHNTPYQLVLNGLIIKPVFILKEIVDEYSDNKKVFIEIPNKFISHIDVDKVYNLYDFHLKIKKQEHKKGVTNYEIRY